jgi:tripartite-type tricarboxylate transporter receptor subunit TctC
MKGGSYHEQGLDCGRGGDNLYSLHGRQPFLGGHVDFAMQFPSTCIPLAEGKKLRMFAVSSEKRLRSLPDVPTLKELGVDVVFHMWLGLAVPLKTPQPIVDKLRDVFKKVIEDKVFIKLVEGAGNEVEPLLGDELMTYWDKDSEMHAKVFQQIVKETVKEAK